MVADLYLHFFHGLYVIQSRLDATSHLPDDRFRRLSFERKFTGDQLVPKGSKIVAKFDNSGQASKDESSLTQKRTRQ